ncbi:MAG: polyphosphate kinase 1 [Thermoleophilia bacterium]|nr:polyphosphate kinase 1 [Thermoleophilia bacterium]
MASSDDHPAARLLNRELSWVEFNARVLDLACEETQPLLERVKFCAIFSSNLDEFFMVRVAGLMGQESTGVAVPSADGMGPLETLAAIRARVSGLTERLAHLWTDDLLPSLAAAGVVISTVEECTVAEIESLRNVFEQEIYPVLTPLAVGSGKPFPYISGLSLSLCVLAVDPDTGEERFARVKVPEGLDRFVTTGKRLVPLEAVIAHYLPALFPGMTISEHAVFRVTRDADLELSDDADDLLQAVESELSRRRFGDVVRIEVSASASEVMLDRLLDGLGAPANEQYTVEGLLDLADLMQLMRLDRADLKDKPWVPVTQPRLARAKETAHLFDEIRKNDLLVHQPYESFKSSFEAFAAAAVADDDVIAMKAAVYRTSEDSALVSALIECAEQGKQAVCVVELKARFDERRNIDWSRELEYAGVHVVHGFPDMKIHSKMTLVVRREEGGLRRYVHIGTGNYHASTARLYEDIGLFTADEDIAADVADLFNYVTGFGRPQRFRKLLVAPFEMRERLVKEIHRVAEAARDGEKARIRLKLNSLVDPTVINELYAAAAAGVHIDICARSVCMLKPGIAGLSETIHVRSILGRFLEHSRIYSFSARDTSTILIGSADLMPRNLDHRVEVLVPVEDVRARQELQKILDSVFDDNVHAWALAGDGSWSRVPPKKQLKTVEHQSAMMQRAQQRARRQPDRISRTKS